MNALQSSHHPILALWCGLSYQDLTCLVPREATKSRTLGGMRRLGGAT